MARSKPAETSRRRYRPTPTGVSDRVHLIDVIRDGTGCSATAAKATLDTVLGTLSASLKKNKKVQLRGFGSFVVTKRPARKGRNPRTGEAIRIGASKSVRFRAARALRDSV